MKTLCKQIKRPRDIKAGKEKEKNWFSNQIQKVLQKEQKKEREREKYEKNNKRRSRDLKDIGFQFNKAFDDENSEICR